MKELTETVERVIQKHTKHKYQCEICNKVYTNEYAAKYCEKKCICEKEKERKEKEILSTDPVCRVGDFICHRMFDETEVVKVTGIRPDADAGCYKYLFNDGFTYSLEGDIDVYATEEEVKDKVLTLRKKLRDAGFNKCHIYDSLTCDGKIRAVVEVNIWDDVFSKES